MKKITVIAGHPNMDSSTANKTIINILEKESNIKIINLMANYSDYKVDAEKEINNLLESDVIVLQFPFHWYGVPAILKMWIDSITTPLVYGPNKGGLKGKKFVLSTTTGGPKEAYQASGYNKYTMKELLLPLLKLGDSLEMDVLDPIVLHSAMFQDEDGKNDLISNANQHALKLVEFINK
jgi:putative NADPH-quinone reductase